MMKNPSYPQSKIFPEANFLIDQTRSRDEAIKTLLLKIKMGTNALAARIEAYKGPDKVRHINNFNRFAKRMQRLADALSNIVSYDEMIREALATWNAGNDIIDDEVAIPPKVVKTEIPKESKEEAKDEKPAENVVMGEPVMTPNNLQKEEVKVVENERRE